MEFQPGQVMDQTDFNREADEMLAEAADPTTPVEQAFNLTSAILGGIAYIISRDVKIVPPIKPELLKVYVNLAATIGEGWPLRSSDRAYREASDMEACVRRAADGLLANLVPQEQFDTSGTILDT